MRPTHTGCRLAGSVACCREAETQPGWFVSLDQYQVRPDKRSGKANDPNRRAAEKKIAFPGHTDRIGGRSLTPVPVAKTHEDDS